MPSGDDAATSGALVVGVFTVIVGVLSTETPPTSFPEGALVATVVGLLFIALEAIGEGWLALSSFAQYRTARNCDVSVWLIIIRGSLSGADGGNGHGGWSGGATLVKVGEESSANGGMGKTALDIEQLTLGATFVVLYLRATPLETLELVNV